MKARIIAVFAACLLALLYLPAEADAADLPENAETLILCGETEWNYSTMPLEDFMTISDIWYKDPAYFELDRTFAGSFGNRAQDGNNVLTGWRSHSSAIILRTTFEIKDLEKAKNSHLYSLFFFDNTVRVYINDKLVFENEWWNNETELIEFDPGDSLKEGSNEIEVSVADDAGGREFALTLFLSEEEIVPEIPEGPADDDPDGGDPGQGGQDEDPSSGLISEIRTNPAKPTVKPQKSNENGAGPAENINDPQAAAPSEMSFTSGVTAICISAAVGVLMIITGMIINLRAGKKFENPENEV